MIAIETASNHCLSAPALALFFLGRIGASLPGTEGDER